MPLEVKSNKPARCGRVKCERSHGFPNIAANPRHFGFFSPASHRQPRTAAVKLSFHSTAPKLPSPALVRNDAAKMADDKTEQPTDKKLRKAREEGQVAKSADTVELACICAVVLVLHAGSAYLGDSLQAVIRSALDFVHGDRSMTGIMATLNKLEHQALAMMLPVASAGVAAAVLALAPQTGFQASMQPVTPKFDKVSPATGFKRIFSMKALLDLAKMIVKATLIFIVMWKAIQWLFPLIASSLYLPAPALATTMWAVLLRLLDIAAMVYLVIAAADYALQQWQFIRQNKMSKDEVKREHKDSEGDPKIKGERKKLAREFASTPPQASMLRANMLVVNPTHYAVAVRYEPPETPLPIVLASGVDAQAAQLRRIALSLGVPIIANPPVARALYKVPLNQPIPAELLDVVAAILRWVDSIGVQRASQENAS